jgi:hypothetical protein
MYKIQFFGYETMIGNFNTITAARKELNNYKKEEKKECKAKYKTVQVKTTKDSYSVNFGCNLYSAGAIVKA